MTADSTWSRYARPRSRTSRSSRPRIASPGAGLKRSLPESLYLRCVGERTIPESRVTLSTARRWMPLLIRIAGEAKNSCHA